MEVDFYVSMFINASAKLTYIAIKKIKNKVCLLSSVRNVTLNLSVINYQ